MLKDKKQFDENLYSYQYNSPIHGEFFYKNNKSNISKLIEN